MSTLPNEEIIQSFDDYKTLSQQERDFYIFQTLHSVKSGIQTILHNFSIEVLDQRYDNRYALKILGEDVIELRKRVQLDEERHETSLNGLRKDMDSRYASKLTEKIIYGACAAILLAALGAIITLIFRK